MESIKGVNQDAVRQAIQIMQRVIDQKRRFNMRSWQTPPRQLFEFDEAFCHSENEAHECGMAACFGGWVALSPEWKSIAGRIGDAGCPMLPFQGEELLAVDAIAAWLGIPKWNADLLTCFSFHPDGKSDFYNGKLVRNVKPQDVIKKLNDMLV